MEMDPLQIKLLSAAPLAPLPVDTGHYVVAVQNKRGELEALKNASEDTWKRLTPIVHFVGPAKERHVPFNAQTVTGGWVKKVAEAVGTHPIYIDVMRLDPTFAVATTAGTAPVLAQIYAAARKRRVRFVPVGWVGQSTDDHLQLVADAALADGDGLALRYRIRTVFPPSGMTHREHLSTELGRAGVDVTSADLLVDLEYIDPDDDLEATDLAPALAEMLDVGAWRSVVVLGTSMPKMLSCVAEGSVGSLPRDEWTLWSQLKTCGLTRVPTFGDYAVQHPKPPQDGGGPSMRANIRYTIDDETLVVRGRGPLMQEGIEQYGDLCQQLVARPEYLGREYSWGDRVFDDCAAGAIEPGSQNMWRGAGTSHHMELVTNQLRQQQQQQPGS